MNRSRLHEHLQLLRHEVDEALNLATLQNIDCPPKLAEAMRYSLLSGGKRLRPLLVLLACEAVGGKRPAALPAACAAEMVHAYSLIHDDLPAMDNDDWRRGKPTNHKVFGEATAILAGDGLLTLAFETLASQIRPAEIAVQCVLDLAQGAGWLGMVGGQQADMEAETEVATLDVAARVAHLEAIHRRKTGRLICASLLIGGRIGGGDNAALQSLEVYGQHVGLAFQIADDLLDVQSSREVLGKEVGKDAALGKLTYPGLLGIEESRLRAEKLVQEAENIARGFGELGWALAGLANYIIERDS